MTFMTLCIVFMSAPDQLVHCRLTNAVPHHAGEGSDAGHAGDVDDAALGGAQVAGGGSGQDEG